MTRTHGGARRGAGRKPIHPTKRRVTVSLRLPHSKLALWDWLAKLRGVNRTKWLEDQIDGLGS